MDLENVASIVHALVQEALVRQEHAITASFAPIPGWEGRADKVRAASRSIATGRVATSILDQHHHVHPGSLQRPWPASDVSCSSEVEASVVSLL